MTGNTLLNGVCVDYISTSDRGLQFGDGLFETMLVKDGRVVLLQQHMQRLEQDAARLGLACPQAELVKRDIETLLHANKAAAHGVIKLILTRGSSERGYSIPASLSPNRVLRFSSMDAGYSSLLCGKLLSGEVCLCQTRASINPSLAGIKHLNRLENVLARNEFDGSEYIDGLILDSDGYIVEGSMSNVFAVSGQCLLTPSLEQAGIRGIMRQQVIELAQQNKLDIRQCRMTPGDLASADAVFITNSLIGMKAVSAIELTATPASGKIENPAKADSSGQALTDSGCSDTDSSDSDFSDSAAMAPGTMDSNLNDSKLIDSKLIEPAYTDRISYPPSDLVDKLFRQMMALCDQE